MAALRRTSADPAQYRSRTGLADGGLVPLDLATATGADTPEVKVLITTDCNARPNRYHRRAAISTVRRYRSFLRASRTKKMGKTRPTVSIRPECYGRC